MPPKRRLIDGVRLAERLEQPVDAVGRDADPGVTDGEVELDLTRRRATPLPSTVSVTVPASVNLTELLSTLSRIWRSRVTSPTTTSGMPAPDTRTSGAVPSSAASDPISATAPSTHSRRSNGASSSSIRSASIFEKSRMSLMIVSSASLDVQNGRGVVALLLVELAAQQQPAHADHRVHRRSDLVAHRGEERALGGVRGVRRPRASWAAAYSRALSRAIERELREALQPVDLRLLERAAVGVVARDASAPITSVAVRRAGPRRARGSGHARWCRRGRPRCRSRRPRVGSPLAQTRPASPSPSAIVRPRSSSKTPIATRRSISAVARYGERRCSRGPSRAARRRARAARAAGRRRRAGASPRAWSREARRARRSEAAAPRSAPPRAARGPPGSRAVDAVMALNARASVPTSSSVVTGASRVRSPAATAVGRVGDRQDRAAIRRDAR